MFQRIAPQQGNLQAPRFLTTKTYGLYCRSIISRRPTPLKIVVADQLPESALELLRSEPAWQIDARSGRAAAELGKDLAEADALIVRSATKVTADLLAGAPRLRIVGRAGTGVDNIDVPAASARGILVVNAPGANSISVAEHACALMLAMARGVSAADRAMKDRKWEKKRFLGTEIRGKTLGIAGLGRIGQEVAQRKRNRLEGEMASLDLGEVKNVVDDLEQRFGRMPDGLRVLPLPPVEPSRAMRFSNQRPPMSNAGSKCALPRSAVR